VRCDQSSGLVAMLPEAHLGVLSPVDWVRVF
jgi:hypothetical protein